MRNRLLTIVSAIILTVPAIALAQSNIPADIKAKMNGYVGTWEVKEETRSSPSAEFVTLTAEWQVRWIFDSLIEWRSTSSSSQGDGSSVEYEGYDPVMQGYTYWFSSDGSRGQIFDGVWDGNTMNLQEISFAADGVRTRNRCTWPYNKDFTAIVNFKCETLTNGSWWVSRTGNAKKMTTKID